MVGSWAFRKKGVATGGPLPARLIVFVLGGAGQAELRCAHELGRDGAVVFGSTALLTPQQFYASLRESPLKEDTASSELLTN